MVVVFIYATHPHTLSQYIYTSYIDIYVYICVAMHVIFIRMCIYKYIYIYMY